MRNFELARRVLAITDVLVIVGCSMQTGTLETLIKQVYQHCPVYFINPNPTNIPCNALLVKQKAYPGIWNVLKDIEEVDDPR